MVPSFIMGVVLTVLLMMAIIGDPIVGSYGQSIIKECEAELPRNQNCRIVAEPIPLDEEK